MPTKEILTGFLTARSQSSSIHISLDLSPDGPEVKAEMWNGKGEFFWLGATRSVELTSDRSMFTIVSVLRFKASFQSHIQYKSSNIGNGLEVAPRQ